MPGTPSSATAPSDPTAGGMATPAAGRGASTPAATSTASSPASSGPSSQRLTRLISLAGALPVLLLVALAAYALAQSHAQYEERAELSSQTLSAFVEQSISSRIQGVDLSIRLLVDYLEQEQREHGRFDQEALERNLALHLEHRPELGSVRVTDASGQVVAAMDEVAGTEVGPAVNFGDRSWFQHQRDQADVGLVMSEPIQSKVNGLRIVSFSRRYVDAHGRFAGVVTASMPLRYLEQLLATVDVGPHGAVVVRNAELNLLARYPAPAEDQDLGRVQRAPSDTVRALAASGRAVVTYRAPSSSDGVDRITTLRRSERAPIVVLVAHAAEDVFADWYRELRIVGLTCAVLLLIYGLGAGLIWRVARQYRAARQRAELLATVFQHSGEAILLTDRDNRIIEVNPAFVEQTGYTLDEVLGRNPRMLASGRTTQEEYEAIWRTLLRAGQWRGELWDRRRDGVEQAKFMSMSIVRDAQGQVTHHIASAIDLTLIKEAERKLQHVSQHDALTHLPNRSHLQGRLVQALATARREGLALAMLVIDLDRFKTINDTLGHQAGDQLLIEVSRRLRGVVRDSDIVARLGGDEFVLVLTHLQTDPGRAASAVAAKVLASLAEPFHLQGHELQSTPSIGISLFPGDGEDAEALLKNADTAMYQAKASGGNTSQFFTPAMNEAATERLVLELGLRGAIERGELFVQYQPQLDVRHHRVVGLEALVRWRHPERGLIPPLKFIPVAEETGQIEAIGAWVLDQALGEVKRWRDVGRMDLRVAVNLSAQQLRRENFDAEVARALSQHDLPGQALELEITESMAMKDPDRTAELLQQLRMLGVGLAIDDFGTGYSSLAYLKRLPLSCLKLDRSFVMDIEHDPNDAAICTATIQMAHSLGLGVVAEGVETQTQLDFLRALGCDTVQGYFISKPLSVADCTAFLQQQEQDAAAAALAAVGAA